MPVLAVLKPITLIYKLVLSVLMQASSQRQVQKVADILHTLCLQVTRLESAGEQAFDEDYSDQDDDLSQAGTPHACPDFSHDQAEELQVALSNLFPDGEWNQEIGITLCKRDKKMLTIKPFNCQLTVSWVMPTNPVKWEFYRFGINFLRLGEGEAYYQNTQGIGRNIFERNVVRTVTRKLNQVWRKLWPFKCPC
jgi:hypothetical protein